MDNLFSTALQAKNPGQILLQEPMSRHTSFHIGGPADIMVIPASEKGLLDVLALARKHHVPVTVIGNGTNLLVRDKGIRGLVIKLGNAIKNWQVNGTKITFSSSLSLAQAAHIALEAGLTGMEFAAGIPGSVGGAIYMNAGAYGGEMKNIVTAVTILDRQGQTRNIPAAEMRFGYRTSAVQGTENLILAATVQLQTGDQEKIAAQMADLAERRRSKQPLELPSAGSTFKRPAGNFAGTLIDKAGLKGFAVGDAQVSVKHAGFVVNTGHASCADVLQLISAVQERVFASAGIHLEPEVLIIGEE
jgi:UDP-N-acetylmuramate dehydrogenase